MPSPERPFAEGQPPKELPAYHQTARYANERPSLKAYTRAQELIFKRTDVELSAYRIIVAKRWHLSVLGDVPPTEVDRRVRAILATGEAASLPEAIFKELNHRRLLAKQMQPWVEAHHVPGKIIHPPEHGHQ